MTPLESDVAAVDALFANPTVTMMLIVLSIWGLAWKGIALWKAARNGQRNWFVIMLLVNLVGILEIYYIFYGQKKKKSAVIPGNQNPPEAPKV